MKGIILRQDRQGLKIGAIEKVAFRNDFNNKAQLLNLSSDIKTSYGSYFKKLVKNAK